MEPDNRFLTELYKPETGVYRDSITTANGDCYELTIEPLKPIEMEAGEMGADKYKAVVMINGARPCAIAPRKFDTLEEQNKAIESAIDVYQDHMANTAADGVIPLRVVPALASEQTLLPVRESKAPDTKDVPVETATAIMAARIMSVFGGELRILSPAGAPPAGVNAMSVPAVTEIQFVRENGDICRAQLNQNMTRELFKLIRQAMQDCDAAFGSEGW